MEEGVEASMEEQVKELQWKKEQAETENQQGSCKQKAKINRVQTQRSRIQSRKRRSKHKGLGFKAAQSRKLAETEKMKATQKIQTED